MKKKKTKADKHDKSWFNLFPKTIRIRMKETPADQKAVFTATLEYEIRDRTVFDLYEFRKADGDQLFCLDPREVVCSFNSLDAAKRAMKAMSRTKLD